MQVRITHISHLFFLSGYFLLADMVGLKAQSFNLIANLEPMTNARAEWIDFNNDALPDLFVAGTNTTGTSKVVIYLNNNDSTFSTLPIANLRDIAYDFADFNSDGYIDILLAGTDDASQKGFDVYQNNSGTSFTTLNLGLTGFSFGGVAWTDLDHDTDLDIIAMGRSQAGDEVTLLYENESGTYTEVTNTITPLANGIVRTWDFNNDGMVETLFSGINGGVPYTTVLTFGQNWQTSTYSSIDGYTLNTIDLADYNADGFMDIALSGSSGTGFQAASNLYTNNGVNGFIRVNPFMDSLSSSSLDFGDLNNDGLKDLVLTGLDTDNKRFFYYYQNAENAGTYSFTDQVHGMENIYAGDVALGDFNSNGDLDIFQIGNSDVDLQANLYSNNTHTSTSNLAPSSPTGLLALTSEDTVWLSWTAATDDLTNTNSLSYNLYISQSPGGANLMTSPLSDISTGFRRIQQPGNAGFSLNQKKHLLPEGNYFWSVQAVDNSYKASTFAPEQAFTICYSFSLGSDTAVCENETILLSAGQTGDVVNWYSLVKDTTVQANALQYTHTVTEKDTLVAEWTKSAFGCTVYDTIVIDKIALPQTDLGQDSLVCLGENITLLVNGMDSVNWYAISSGLLEADANELQFQVSGTDTLITEIYDSNRCVNYDSIVVGAHLLPTFNLGNDTAICFQENLLLEVNGMDSVNWYDASNALLTNSRTLDYQVLATEQVATQFYDSNGCVNFDTINVQVIDLPITDIGSDTSICFREFIQLEVDHPQADSVNWFSTISGLLLGDQTTYDHQALYQDTIIAETFNASGCVNYDTVIIEVYPLPQFDMGNDTSICYGSSILLRLPDPSFQEINWYGQAGSQLLQANSWFFDYTVIATDTLIAEVINTNGCVNYDTLVIAVDDLPVYDLGSDRGVCWGDSVTLEVAGSWEEVNWLTTANQVLNPDNPTYSYRVTDTVTLWTEVLTDKGCVTYDTLTVNALPLPEFELGEEQKYCLEQQVKLSVDPIADVYNWRDEANQPVSNSATWSFVATTSERLSLLLTGSNSCSYADTLLITVNALPDFDIEGTGEICAGQSTELSISLEEYEHIVWYETRNDTLSEQSGITYAPTTSSTLKASVTDLNQCSSVDSILIQVNALPAPAAGNDSLICYGQSLLLGETPQDTASTYSWTPTESLNESTLATPLATPTETTRYILEMTDINGCINYDSTLIEVNPEIFINAGDSTALCIGDSILIGGTPTAQGSQFDYTYRWSPPVFLSDPEAPNPMTFTTEDITYYLEVRSGDCFVEYDTIFVRADDAPEIAVSPLQSIGAGQSVQLFAEGGVSYQWWPETSLNDPSLATPLATPLESTVYQVQVTDENGCTAEDTVSVLVQNILFIPNLFTPNGDGSNDYFMVYGSGVKTIHFSVFDLNNNRVFHTSEVQQAMQIGWDGRYRGQYLPNGTYIWSIQGVFENGSKLSFDGKTKGTFKLLR